MYIILTFSQIAFAIFSYLSDKDYFSKFLSTNIHWLQGAKFTM